MTRGHTRLGIVVVAPMVMLTTMSASAQVSPTSPPHPNMLWNLYNPTKATYGEFVQYIQVPAQQVTIQIPVAGGPPDQLQPQSVQIPGYTVTETTTGYWYPERMTLVQAGPGSYQWAKLPAEFKKK